jgi:hypothetical protein
MTRAALGLVAVGHMIHGPRVCALWSRPSESGAHAKCLAGFIANKQSRQLFTKYAVFRSAPRYTSTALRAQVGRPLHPPLGIGAISHLRCLMSCDKCKGDVQANEILRYSPSQLKNSCKDYHMPLTTCQHLYIERHPTGKSQFKMGTAKTGS